MAVWGQRDSAAGKVFALYVEDTGLLPSISYGSPSTAIESGATPEHCQL